MSALTGVTAVAINCRSRWTPGWPSRAKVLGSRITAERPHFVAACEAYAGLRGSLDRAMPTVTLAGVNRGKALFYDAEWWRLTPDTLRKYSLGHGKHAIAARFTHRVTGKPLIVVSLHLLVGSSKRPKRRAELGKLLGLVLRDYTDAEACLLIGDFNDTSDALSSVYWRHMFRDLRHGVRRSQQINATFNTYNGFTGPAPRNGKQIDLVLGRWARGDAYRVIVSNYARQKLSKSKAQKLYGSDHWAVVVRATLR